MRLAALSLVLAAGVAGFAVAQVPSTPGGKAAVARQENFKQLGASFKTINDELKKGDPDKAAISAAAVKVKAASTQVPTWFPRGSGPEAYSKTYAKGEVWTDAAGFATAAKAFQTEAAKLQLVSEAGDIDAIRAQVRATGGSCKGCHDKYRTPKD